MRRPAFLLALVLAAALSPLAPRPAAADPFTNAFEDLLLELNARDEALPDTGLTPAQKKEKAGLAKAFRALASDSGDVAGDLRIAGKMAKALGAAYPEDGEIAGLLAGALDALEVLVRDGRDELEATLEGLAEGPARIKAAGFLARCDETLLLADGAVAAATRAKLLSRAQTYVRKGAAAAEKAAPVADASSMSATVRGAAWAANSDFGTAVGGLANVSEAGGLRNLHIRGRRILPKSGVPQGDPPLPGATSTLDLHLDAITANIEAGTYAVGNSGGYGTSATFTEEDEDGDVHVATAESGTVVIQTLAINLGSVDVTGTFTLTLRDGETSQTFTIVSGTFVAEDLPRTTAP